MEKINNVMDLMNVLDTIEYGWMDIDKNVYINTEKGFKKKYVLSRPEDVLEKKVGNNFDQVELERSLFKNLDLKFSTYFMVYYDAKKLFTHTFLVSKLIQFLQSCSILCAAPARDFCQKHLI